MADTPLYVGIDLGTTNSAAAVFDGEHVSVIRNAQGGTVTPSVVRLDKQGRVTVGTRARRFVEQDPANTAAEFKRLMGTEKAIEFPGPGSRASPRSCPPRSSRRSARTSPISWASRSSAP